MTTESSPRAYDAAELLRKYDPENRLAAFYERLAQESRRVNIVSRETLVQAVDGQSKLGAWPSLAELAAESLLPLESLTDHSVRAYLDIGSGGGFPSVPIIVARRPAIVTLVERTQKKAAALRRILISLGLRAEIIPESFEQARDLPDGYDLVTLRQVRLSSTLLERIRCRLVAGGALVYFGWPDFDVAAESFTREVFEYVSHSGKQLRISIFCRV